MSAPPAEAIAARGRRSGPRSRAAESARPWLIVPALGAAALAVLPLVYLLVRAADAGWAGAVGVLLAPATLRLLGRTVLLVLGVLGGAVAVALPLAWLVARTDLPLRRLWGLAGALPLIFPSYVGAFCLVAVLGPRGYLQGWLEPLGIERLPAFIYGYSGAVLTLTLFTYPYLYLLLLAALRELDPSCEEGSRMLGRGPWSTFFRAVLPNLRPPLLAGGLLVALYTLADFGGVSIVRFNTFTLAIYNSYRALFDRTGAAVLGLVLVALTLGCLILESRLERRVRPAAARPGRAAPPLSLGAWRSPALAFVGLVVGFGVVLPTAVILVWSGYGLARPAGGAVVRGALNSLGVSTAAALVAVMLAVPVAVWAVRHRSRVSALVERLCFTGHALPGLVLALALVFFAARHLRPLYQTVALLVIAYVVRFLPAAVAATRSALRSLGRRYEEAARSLGRGPAYTLRTVTVPLVRPGVLAGAGLVFLSAMKELPATLILGPAGFETLATRVWRAASEAIYADAALPALVLVGISAVPVYALVIRPAMAERRTV